MVTSNSRRKEALYKLIGKGEVKGTLVVVDEAHLVLPWFKTASVFRSIVNFSGEVAFVVSFLTLKRP